MAIIDLEAALLQLLNTPAHGLDVIRRLREWSGGTVPASPGGVYPALHRLERHGLVRCWSGSAPARGGRRRRYYELTVAGVQLVAEERARLARLVAPPPGIAFPSEAVARRRMRRCLELSGFLLKLREAGAAARTP